MVSRQAIVVSVRESVQVNEQDLEQDHQAPQRARGNGHAQLTAAAQPGGLGGLSAVEHEQSHGHAERDEGS